MTVSSCATAASLSKTPWCNPATRLKARQFPGVVEMLATPPSWLVGWRRILTNMRKMFARAVVLAYRASRLGDPGKVTRTLVDAKPEGRNRAKPRPVMQAAPQHCPHDDMKRHGNSTGRYATCNKCQARWKWVEDGEARGWRFHPSSKSSVLPLPSAQTVLDTSWTPAAPWTMASSSTGPQGAYPKTRPRPTSATSAFGYSGTRDEETEENTTEDEFDWALVMDC